MTTKTLEALIQDGRDLSESLIQAELIIEQMEKESLSDLSLDDTIVFCKNLADCKRTLARVQNLLGKLWSKFNNRRIQLLKLKPKVVRQTFTKEELDAFVDQKIQAALSSNKN